jgi:peptidyl-prolyl cis-trans isomerase SurA
MLNRFFCLSTVNARAVAIAAAVAFLVAVSGPARAGQEARIAAVVDEEPISFLDLVNRTRLVMFATGLAPTEENMNRLMPQILNSLIDESLQWQEAKAQNVTVRDKEVEDALAGMEQRNNLPPGGLDGFLASKGVEKSALINQVRSSIAWAKLVDRRLRPQVEIGDEEVDDALRRIAENQGKPQLLVSEIFLAVDDSAADTRVLESAMRIGEQIRAGASFEALARAFSQNATAAAGGDLGWLIEGQFEEEIGRVLAAMQPGHIAGPIRTPDGYHILLLRDRRLPGGSTADRVTVDLRQIGLPLPPSATKENIRAALDAAESIRSRVTDCVVLESAPLAGDAVVSRIGRIRVADLAAPLQATVMRLDTNQISAPLRAEQGIVLFMVCDREADDLELPGRDQIQRRLELEKLDLLARRYLRDLRRGAFVDIRI